MFQALIEKAEIAKKAKSIIGILGLPACATQLTTHLEQKNIEMVHGKILEINGGLCRIKIVKPMGFTNPMFRTDIITIFITNLFFYD